MKSNNTLRKKRLSFEEVKATLKQIKGKQVVLLGDCMLDEYLFGSVDRISPEAPVPVVKVMKKEVRAGGAANVALNMQALGGKPFLIGLLGRDHEGKTLKTLLKKRGITGRFLERPDLPTITKTRVVAYQQQVVRIDKETSTLNLKKTDLVSLFPENISLAFDALCFSDYNKGFLQKQLTHRWIQFAHKRRKPITADPKPCNCTLFKKVTVISPNLHEAEKIVGFSLKGKKDFQKAAQQLQKQFGIQKVLISLGEKGMFFYNDESGRIIPALSREVYDVTGAGDTVLAALTLSLAGGIPFSQACCFANFAAAAVVQKLGTSFTTPDELLRLAREA